VAIFTPKRLSGPALLTTSTASAYVVPAGRTGVVKQIILNNTSTTANTVTVHLVPNGGTAATANEIVSDLNIAGYSQIIWAADLPLSAGDSIQLSSSLSNTITATISGIEIT
jgi:hypothetical protein